MKSEIRWHKRRFGGLVGVESCWVPKWHKHHLKDSLNLARAFLRANFYHYGRTRCYAVDIVDKSS